MKENEFENLWESTIAPRLKELEKERKKAQHEIVSIIIFFFGLWFLFMPTTEIFPFLPFGVINIIGLIVVSACVYSIQKNKNSFRRDYKEQIYTSILKQTKLDWKLFFSRLGWREILNMQRKKDGSIQENEEYQTKKKEEYSRFTESGLFSGTETIEIGEILETTMNGQHVRATEIKTTEVRGSGKHRRTILIFQGFHVTFNVAKPYRGKTYVYTEKDKAYTPKSKNFFNTSDVEETILEWGDFEEFLKVESTDMVEAREILTPDFMQVLYDWWIEHKKDVRFAFREDTVHIAIPSSLTFEPKLFDPIEQEKEAIREHIELLRFIEKILDITLYHQRRNLNGK